MALNFARLADMAELAGFAKLAARLVESGVGFGAAFNNAGFPLSGSQRDQIVGQRVQQISPQFPSIFGGFGLRHGGDGVAQHVHRSGETDPI